MVIEDLDALRPEPRRVKIGGHEIDVSFVPCGITFDVDRIVQDINAIGISQITANGEETRKAFNLSIELCSVFCSRKHPELDVVWFNDNVDAMQIRAFVDAIREALARSYAGVSGENPQMAPQME